MGVTWNRIDTRIDISYSQAIWPAILATSELSVHLDNFNEEQRLLLVVGTAFVLPLQVALLCLLSMEHAVLNTRQHSSCICCDGYHYHDNGTTTVDADYFTGLKFC